MRLGDELWARVVDLVGAESYRAGGPTSRAGGTRCGVARRDATIALSSVGS